MKITVFCPKPEFTKDQQGRLAKLGQVIYTKSRDEYPMEELVKLCKDSEILAFDPDNIGGFEKTPKRLLKLMEAMSKIKGLVLSTTAFGYVDFEYCKKKNIVVTNVPYYSTESVAEHTLAFLLGSAKRIFLTDRRSQKRKYRLELGYELKGKTLGIIGLGNIGSRVADLGKAVGMKVIGYNRTPKKKAEVTLKSINKVLSESDAICLHLAENEETKGFLSKERIAKLKKGVFIINTSDRSLVDEKAMAKSLKSGKVDTYVLEAEDLDSPPLGDLENAILFRGFGWYTKESLERNKEIWVNNIEGVARNKPINSVKK